VPWTEEEALEQARLGGLASGEKRRRRAKMTPRERALEAITKNLGPLVQELLAAAHGEGDFEGLDPKLRLTATLRALEYAIGRPVTPKAAKDDGKPAPPPVPTADDLFADAFDDAEQRAGDDDG
jgi:hypothetical protein